MAGLSLEWTRWKEYDRVIYPQSETYNAFINAGYDRNGTKNGVYLKDKDSPVDLSEWAYLVTDDSIILTDYLGSNQNIVIPELPNN